MPRKPQPQTPPWPQILSEAQHRFGIHRFRPGQREVLEHVFAGRDTLVLMPTGAGKSLTYQLPACFLPHPVLVVSPLIALMQDQQEKAEEAHLRVDKLDSTLTQTEAAEAAEDIATGTAQLIYCTPERLQTPEFQQSLRDSGGISLLVVDEAHTIAQWGHDFRPAFLAIGDARRKLGDPPILALTATATPEVAQEILTSLHARNPAIVQTGTQRENLLFAVRPAVNNEAKFARILSLLNEEDGTGILYTASVRSANELFDFLTEHGISAGRYHGKMPTRQREAAQANFMQGVYKVMIATKAFGLGIDKPDIRFIFHFEFPDSLETYLQEAGRAGRDGKPATALLLYRLEDKRIQSFFLAGRYPRLEELDAVYTAIPDADSPLKNPPIQAPGSGSPGPASASLTGGDAVQESPAQPADPAAAFASITRVGRRRTQVILNLLSQSGLIRRTPRGYRRIPSANIAPETLESLLRTYTDRAVRDKERLAEMMHYAETSGCRTQVLRTYFAEPEGEPCRRCDNCARASALTNPVEPAAQSEASQPELPALLVEDSEPTTAPHEEVHIIETATGSFQTTRDPAELIPAQSPTFAPGDRVHHKRFGAGTVLDLHAQIALVRFQNSGQKRLRADFLQPAA
jgi:ATP-dependent DNA helicase RecQ